MGKGPTFSHHLLLSFHGTFLKFSYFHLDGVGSHGYLRWREKNETIGPTPTPDLEERAEDWRGLG